MALFDPKKNQISALQKSIEDKNRAIGVYYNEIGMLYYKQFKDMNADVSKEINSRCENISTLYIEIEECRLRILYERGYKECANCKKENLLEHAYCSACGQKFPESNDVSVVTRVDPVTLGPVGLKANDVPVVPVAATAAAVAAVEEPEVPAEVVETAEAAVESVEAEGAVAADLVEETVDPAVSGVAEAIPTEEPAEASAVVEEAIENAAEGVEEAYILAGDVACEVEDIPEVAPDEKVEE